MRTQKIQTGPGKYRTVWIATGSERRAYVRLARQLAKFERALATRKGVADVAHGFVAGRSPVTMATAHIGYDVTVSLDLANWFPSITADELVAAGLTRERAEKCCVLGRLVQGLPTSPAAANIAAVTMDYLLATYTNFAGSGMVYTRYADDITVSWLVASPGYLPDTVITFVSDAVRKMGWVLNEHKTRIQYASAGRRIICGLSVGEADVRATRSVRHRLRACQHARPGTNQTRGLAEWAACKLPGSGLARAQVTRRLSREE